LKASPAYILTGLVLGGALGFLCAHSRYPLVVSIPHTLAPIGTLFLSAIRVCVIPLVTSSLVVGCAASRDTGRVGRLAGKSLILVLCYLVLAAGFAGALAFPIFQHIGSRIGVAHQEPVLQSAATEPSGLGAWVSELIPSNLFNALAGGALLPLVVFSIAFGLAVSRMPADRRDVLLRWFRAISEAFTRLIDAILLTAPVGVFCLAAGLAAAAGLGGAGALLGYVVVLSLISGCFIVSVLYLSVALFAPVSLLTFIRAAAPAQAMAFTSRSSLASLPATYQAARVGLRIPDELSSFFFPFAASIFRVGGCMAPMVGICFLSSFYGVPISWTKLAAVSVSSVAISMTVPGIPGGAILVMAPMLTALGIPSAGMAMLLAVDTVPDMFRTTANVTGWLAAGTILSSESRSLTEAMQGADQAEPGTLS
jgi:proton glutamate symport protein